MANSRKSAPADADAPEAALRASLSRARPARIAVALSGGRDSMVLLHALSRLRQELGIELSAIHVDHGLCAEAAQWATFCERECVARGIALQVARVRIERRGGESLEATARDARYAALMQADAETIALAHHADDQAETVLLQLLRGAGPHGAAAMPRLHERALGPALLRPFIDLPAAALHDYARLQSLNWIEDPSNRDATLRRNALRHDIMPRLRDIFPGVPRTLARAAARQAEAARLLDDLAALDSNAVLGSDARYGPTLDRTALAALIAARPDRARNLLRWFVRRHALPSPSTARLEALLAQCASTRDDARVRVIHAGVVIESNRGRLVVHALEPAVYASAWRGEARLVLACGTLTAAPGLGNGIATRVLAQGPLRVEPRRGGERLRSCADHRARNVAALFGKAAIPIWERDRWPLLWQGNELVAVPGLAIGTAFRAHSDEPGYVLDWQPNTLASPVRA